MPSRDANHIPRIVGVSYLDGTTAVPIAVDPTTGYLLCDVRDTGVAGTIIPHTVAYRDESHIPTMIGVIDGTNTIQRLNTTNDGYLKVDIPPI